MSSWSRGRIITVGVLVVVVIMIMFLIGLALGRMTLGI